MRIDTSIKGLLPPLPSRHESVRRAARQVRTPGIDLRLSLVTGFPTLAWRFAEASPREELAVSDILRTASAVAATPGAFLIGGGEPLLRTDLWELLSALARMRPLNLGVLTSGQGASESTVRRLRSVGVQRVSVPFHCARQDAHDWLVGRPGALKAAHRAIRTCIDADLPVGAEIVLTRPTIPHLTETIEVLARVGVRTICVRRLTAGEVDGPSFVPMSPRLSLLEESLTRAAETALQRRVRLTLRDLPLCVAPRLRPLFAAPGSEGWVKSDGTIVTRADAGYRCATCPDAPQCAGVPQDYGARFGWEEFVDPEAAAERVRDTVKDQQIEHPSQTMAFHWRGPQRVRCAACADAAPAESSAPPQESTRVVRARLVQAALHRPALLRLVGADLLAHPQSALLIFDALRLFPRVEVAGEASAVVDWSDLDLRRLKDLRRIDVALYGPDAATHDAHCGIPGAFEAMQRGVERLRSQTSIQVGAYAIIHDACHVPAFASAWESGDLPGAPRFRLSSAGSSLDELVECARALAPGPTRSALLAVLPRCLWEQEGLALGSVAEVATLTQPDQAQHVIERGRSLPYHPCGSDPIGAFETCREEAQSCPRVGCPGTAVGWQSTARVKAWI